LAQETVSRREANVLVGALSNSALSLIFTQMAQPAWILVALLLTGVESYRVKKSNSQHTGAVDADKGGMEADLKERSSQSESSLEESDQLDQSLSNKRKPRSKNGWCLPHQQCTYSDCCSWGTSCNTCPGGYKDYRLVPLFSFERCTWKGHFFCSPQVINCQGSYSEWSTCSAACGGGTQTKQYSLDVHPENGGSACPSATMSQACNTKSCPIDCQGSWSDVGECSATCGGGLQTQQFTVSVDPAHGGSACPTSQRSIQQCNAQSCPAPVDCKGEWSAWGECSKSCGTGSETKTFQKTVNASHGGAECAARQGETDTRPCKAPAGCPAEVMMQKGVCRDATNGPSWGVATNESVECCCDL